MGKITSKIFEKLKKIWFAICCGIYNIVITIPFTRAIYKHYAT